MIDLAPAEDGYHDESCSAWVARSQHACYQGSLRELMARFRVAVSLGFVLVMPEFRKLFDLPAARLYRADIADLGRLISSAMQIKPQYCEFLISDGDTTHRASSVDALLSQQLPRSVDGLSFTASGWNDDNDIDRGISVNLRRTMASCHIYSVDEVWFKGKAQQITEFFARRGPWYANIANRMAFLFGVFETLFFAGFFYFLWVGQVPLAMLSGIAFGIFQVGFSTYLNGRLFPHIDIQLYGKPRRLSREILMVIFTGIMAACAAAGISIQVTQMANP